METNHQRLKQIMLDISKFGALEGGGITRLAFSDEEKLARNYLFELFKDLGLDVKQDGIGNIFVTLKGETNLPPVVVGSHIDSVINGGFYDGTLGVVCGIECIQTILKKQINHKRDIVLAIFSAEESSRFKMATIGSKVISGKLSISDLHRLKDSKNVSAYDAAKNFGCDLKPSSLQPNSWHSYLELHIEQGPVLWNNKIPVGIVTGIAAPIRFEVEIFGRADHSGATPMNMRKDALSVACKIISHIDDIAKAGDNTVATVGYINATPGVLNVIPGSVKFGVDIRDIDENGLENANLEIRKLIQNITKEYGCMYEIYELTHDKPVALDKEVIDLLVNIAERNNIPFKKLPSGAGHDAMNIKGIASKVGMIFIPCEDGISHNISENVNYKDVFIANDFLCDCILKFSNE